MLNEEATEALVCVISTRGSTGRNNEFFTNIGPNAQTHIFLKYSITKIPKNKRNTVYICVFRRLSKHFKNCIKIFFFGLLKLATHFVNEHCAHLILSLTLFNDRFG
jgi:hypothetical protein